MIVPGSNLLGIALGVIGSQEITLSKFSTRSIDTAGRWINQYAPAIPVEGSWQPIDQRQYSFYGLDLQRKYFMFYTTEPINSVQREAAPDIATRMGRRYETVGDTPWSDVDGWCAAMFVDVGADI